MKHKNKGVKKLSIKDFIFGNLFNGKSANYKAKDVLGNTISKTEQLIGFFEPTNRPVFRKAIPFNFTGLNSYELAHNLDILNYIGIYYFSKQYGVIPLYYYISNQDKENGNNGYSINPEQKKLTITSDSLLNYNLIDGYIIIEYTKTNVESGLYCEDDIIDTNIDLQSLGQLCLTYANSNPNSCDPQLPIELIDVLLEFEKQICYTINNPIQSDYNQTNNTSPDYIKNKPDLSNFVNVQVDMSETDETKPEFVKNKNRVINISNTDSFKATENDAILDITNDCTKTLTNSLPTNFSINIKVIDDVVLTVDGTSVNMFDKEGLAINTLLVSRGESALIFRRNNGNFIVEI